MKTRRRLISGPVLVEEADIPAVSEQIDAVHDALDRFWRQVDRTSGSTLSRDHRLRFITAVAEIAANIVRHAYPVAPGNIQLHLRLYPDRVEAAFTDWGVP